MKRLLFALAGLAWLAGAGTGAAAPRVEADPNKEYVITPEAGPWMIRAAVYVGEEARQKAHELILEIRSRYNLPAYVMNYGEEERRKRQMEMEELRKKFPDRHIPLRTTRIQDQCAVLVGGYKTMDEARSALKGIKQLKPSSERLMDLFTRERPVADNPDKAVVEGTYVSPFLNSFVVPNPTVPRQREVKSDYPFYKKLNEYESLSVLKCRKPWTMVVAKYQGAQMIQSTSAPSGFLDKLWGNNTGEALEASGHNAHNLADALCKLGFEAYVLHTRWGSVVTVGGYDRPDDPQMRQVEEALTSRFQFSQSVGFLPRPWPPMEVPHP
jgi:hypothetical protein